MTRSPAEAALAAAARDVDSPAGYRRLHRTIWTAHDHGLSWREIAEATGIPLRVLYARHRNRQRPIERNTP